MQKPNDLNQRIAELAVFLDPIAFQHDENCSLEKRRKAAWREAANRIRQ
jgi:hypothetical protein